MKVSNNKDVDISALARSKKSEKAKAAKENSNADAASPAGIADSTQVSISGEAKAISQAKQIAKSEDVNQEKVDRIKAMMAAGTYKPDYSKVADKVVNELALQEMS